MERHIIYNVNKEEYDSCTITNNKPRIIAYCKDPHESKYVSHFFKHTRIEIPNIYTCNVYCVCKIDDLLADSV